MPLPSPQVQDVDAEEVPTTALSMEFFDKLYTNDILRRDGSIKGCIPECLDNGMEINQEITKVLHMPESEQYDMFVPEERQEFLFQLFSLLVTGGPLNQYEDNVGPYFDLTRSLYKIA
ncbi:hypothetical protein PTSG_08679 [Salpingoeca rosetta]|uniref:Cilia- and flagella-associated protein 300 n=1 Tax=Salpingoeca rosetta (strain ATCC 50818 / BSB-021) TaxID=946362 RepID=F2UKD3_SALR5|nr:uncharacterized protein PTSG_08679 [Salpingoeca rosetta]EGD77582.1 hypothetical protein PTSG_08679 [Salpingoeca rosetta]|eukprot:XP_004990470.1 hypothetical protein PTSG_08679 [Salpingoeca rosetta]